MKKLLFIGSFFILKVAGSFELIYNTIGDIMLRLKNEFISVGYESGSSYGGSQRLSGNNTLSRCGCGLVAAVDMLLYIHKNHPDCFVAEFSEFSLCKILPKEKYNELLQIIRHRYLPIIPHFGMNGLGLMTGVQLFFKRHHLPFSCVWCISDRGLWTKVKEMLSNDIPVIMSVGPNFPKIWKNGRAALYTKDELGEYKPASLVKAHFITVTGIDEQWLEISSWGRRYYLNRRMYEEYVSNYSAALVSNILYVKKKK